jgi:dihydrofolate synthase/folylpolyglutamate synthase
MLARLERFNDPFSRPPCMQPALEVVDRQSALDYLFGRINYERTSGGVPYRSNEFKLDRMRRLLAGLGDPHLALKAIHIAGTKGKGSTAAMIASILRAADKKVGVYTSPHLVDLEERMVVDGRQCEPERFVGLVSELQQVAERMDRDSIAHERRTGPTFFEITTAMAMLHFARQNVDAAVLEVGLGGRLDSTNVCEPVVCAITNISFDHTKQLGNTLSAIATEKAGIIKPGVPVVSGVLDDEPRQVIEAIAQERQSPLLQRERDFGATPYDLERVTTSPAAAGSRVPPSERLSYWDHFERSPYSLDEVAVGMLGGHQVQNASVAIAIARKLHQFGWAISDAAIRRGLIDASCPARVEVFGTQPTRIIDVAHNLASVEALVKVLDVRFAADRRVLVFASSRDKDTVGMLRLLLPRFDTVVLTRYMNNPRAIEPVELQQFTDSILNEPADAANNNRPVVETSPNPAAAWQRAQQLATENDLICITGSFFLAAEIRPLLA